jgi:hypothetical protein
MNKTIKEVLTYWQAYSQEVKAKSKETTDKLFEQQKRMSEDWRKEVDRINNEPNPKCLITGAELFRIKQYPPMPFVSIPNVEQPTFEGFMDYLTKQL